MLSVREPDGAEVAIATVAVGLTPLVAAAGVILSAICAMKTPRPPITAAVMTMLRMTHAHSKQRQISPRPPRHRDQTRPAEAAIFAKRMSEALIWWLTSPAA